jgi:hypothetical protein
MLRNAELAGKVSERLITIFADLEDTVRLVASEEPDDLQMYRQAIGRVCGALVLDVMAPLYASHPSIKPASWIEAER